MLKCMKGYATFYRSKNDAEFSSHKSRVCFMYTSAICTQTLQEMNISLQGIQILHRKRLNKKYLAEISCIIFATRKISDFVSETESKIRIALNKTISLVENYLNFFVSFIYILPSNVTQFQSVMDRRFSCYNLLLQQCNCR